MVEPLPLDRFQAEFAAALQTRRTPAERGLVVYRNNVYAGLADTLGEAYPAVRRLVGEDFFRALASIYLDRHLPDSASLTLFGARFPDFIETFPPARSVPYLGDVARLERAWLEAFHAADATPLPRDALAGLPAHRISDLHVELAPSVRLLKTAHRISSVWRDNRAPDATPGGEPPSATSERLLIHRRDGIVEIETLAPPEFAFLTSLAASEPLAHAAETAFEIEPDFDLPPALAQLVLRELAIAFHIA